MGFKDGHDLIMHSLDKPLREMIRRGKLVEEKIALERPELLNLFLTYQNEAVEARRFLDTSLIGLARGAAVLEVGGGILALAIELASEGFEVTTVEPVGDGFAGIHYLMNTFAEVAQEENVKFRLIKLPIEECKFDQKFDFIFSINVMEHLRNPYLVLLNLVSILKPEAKYRYFSPNYDFPYEPHFGKWLFTRKNGAFHLQKSRATSPHIPREETDGIYKSLNFLTFRNIASFSQLNLIRIRANSNASYDLLQRINRDKVFAHRHGALTFVVKLSHLLKLYYFVKLVPVKFQPVMDIEAFSFKV